MTALPAAVDSFAIVLTPHAGDGRIDAEIRERQEHVRNGLSVEPSLERLGWLYVAKARDTFDAGFYKLAEQCALVLDSRQAGSPAALLLRGHALQSQHRFREAEALACTLVKQRGLAFDYGLLGDILADVGRVDDAARAYQSMLDLKPDPQGYARAAHIRWIKGDLDGAIELMRMATRGASPRDPESAAWMHTQLARYLWQSQANDEAERALAMALQLNRDYAPALLLSGRMLLAADKFGDAIQRLRLAASANPLPEYQWALAEALRASGREKDARSVEAELARRGACSDPRSCSLYLATRRESVETALSLAREELAERRDVFTYDALAWALAAAGEVKAAQTNMALALAHGTQDARLFFHAAVISSQAGKLEEAGHWFAKAKPLTALLLPIEREQLQEIEARVRRSMLSDTTYPESFPAAVNVSAAAEN